MFTTVKIIAAVLLATGLLRAETPLDLAAMSLEELMNVEVNLVSRTAGSLFASPAAVYVLTGDDIRRSGATTIADALRLVPGMQVSRIDGNKWAISARGFNGRFAQQLLVLIDGRSVYTPLFSGVFWEVQDVLLADVERIEVVRGPGATLWGANAVNGVINVVTRKTGETQDNLVQAGTGTQERGFIQARHGGGLGTTGTYRVWAKGFARDALVDATGRAADDDWRMGRVGFRADTQHDVSKIAAPTSI